jgi:hypothetical protein
VEIYLHSPNTLTWRGAQLKHRDFIFTFYFTRAVCKVRELTLLPRFGTLWRCGDGLLLEVPPLANDALLTTLNPLLQNVLQTVDRFEISCLGAPFSWLERPRNRMGRDLDCMADVLMGFHRSTFSKRNTEFNSYLAPMRLGVIRRVHELCKRSSYLR